MEEDIPPDANEVLIPPLLLQPLVENAIRHGIANLPQGGTIRLSADCKHDAVSILVQNTFDPESTASLKTGLGLENIRQRLRTRYGENAHIAVEANGDRFAVQLRLPAERDGAAA